MLLYYGRMANLHMYYYYIELKPVPSSAKKKRSTNRTWSGISWLDNLPIIGERQPMCPFTQELFMGMGQCSTNNQSIPNSATV